MNNHQTITTIAVPHKFWQLSPLTRRCKAICASLSLSLSTKPQEDDRWGDCRLLAFGSLVCLWIFPVLARWITLDQKYTNKYSKKLAQPSKMLAHMSQLSHAMHDALRATWCVARNGSWIACEHWRNETCVARNMMRCAQPTIQWCHLNNFQ